MKHFYCFMLLAAALSLLNGKEALSNASEKSLDIPNPTIGFVFVGPEWNSILSLNTTIFHSPTGSDLNLNCTANYPIRWRIDGIIDPPEIVKFQPPKRNLHVSPNEFHIVVNMFFLDAQEYRGLAASATVICEKVDDPKIRDEFLLFVRGANPLPQPLVTYVSDSFVIPCNTTDPQEPVTLFRRTATQEEIKVDSVIYDPRKGFISDKIFDGEYICRQGDARVLITANRSKTSTDFEWFPKDGVVKAFMDDKIEFKCISKGRTVDLLIREANEWMKISYLENSKIAKAMQISLKKNSLALQENSTVNGTVACVARENRELIKEWSFKFIETPILHLDNFEGEVNCLSSTSSKRVQTVRCRNRIDCDFMSTCFRNKTWCNFKKQKQFFGEKNTHCYVLALGTGKDCVSTPYSHLNGLAHCSVEGLSKTWDFFVSLRFLRYSNWKDAPRSELLVLDEVPEVLYTTRISTFFCTGTAYLFADSLSFELEYKNGSLRLLESDGVLVNVSNPSDDSPRKIDEFNVLGVLDILLPLEAVSVHCIAPWANSTDTLRTSRNFTTRVLMKPTLTVSSFNDSYDFQNQSFFVGEKNTKLTCFAKGEPQPAYKWMFNGMSVTRTFPKLKVSSGSSGESSLEFPVVEKTFAGIYECIARNSEGEARIRYNLDVEDEPISGQTIVYIVSVVLVLFALAIVMGALFVVYKRYQAAQAVVRSLNDSEIDEFFNGRPELLSNGGLASMDVIDFLPYKSNYEIMMDDIEFDSSNKNWLGAGEFSYVVKGRIISKNKPVAIKISKPSVDVTLFKSLLSEVKIMIYIGEHDHIIPLIGVCTAAIQNRCIYIATEICESGSLDVYLRKSRPEFVDIINANQKIDLNLLPPEGAPLSNIDLINFSAQIAQGMEYLASKNVIHADLAARNVLLTGDKCVKISDFGLSKKLYECNNYVKKTRSPLPWRWMSIEALTTLTFSTLSDVWSYGATLFEIFTLGDIPFPNEEYNTEFINRLTSGMRMGRPKYSTQEIYSKIVACWENEPEYRPSFSTLRSFFEQLLKQFPTESYKKVDNDKENSNPGGIPSELENESREGDGVKSGNQALEASIEKASIQRDYVNSTELTMDSVVNHDTTPVLYVNTDPSTMEPIYGNLT